MQSPPAFCNSALVPSISRIRPCVRAPLTMSHPPRRPAVPTRRRRPPAPPSDPRTDRHAPENLGFLHIATITGAHGVRGEAKVLSEGDFGASRLGSPAPSTVRYLLLPGRRYPRPVRITPARKASQARTWILRVDGVETREEVLALRGARVYVREGDRPRLGKGEYLVGDLVGMRVEVAGKDVGMVDGVITREEVCKAAGSGKASVAVAADLLEVALCEGMPEERDVRVLVPFVKAVVPVVDVERRVIVVDPPLGLFETTVVNRKEKAKAPRGLLMQAKG